MFEQSIIPAGESRRSNVLLAILGQLLVVGILVVMPLMYVQALPSPELMSSILLAPPPPPPPPPPPAPVRLEPSKIVARKFDPSKLTAPTTVPKQVTILSGTTVGLSQVPDIAGVPGGMPGGIPSGAVGGILNLRAVALPPPPVAAGPPEAAPPSRIQVGGNVQAGLLLHQVTPSYPKLASQAHITGAVRLRAVIGRDGTVENLTLISGHPLLIPAAEEAVKQWIYKPTLLNGVPVEVDTEIDVHFVTS